MIKAKATKTHIYKKRYVYEGDVIELPDNAKNDLGKYLVLVEDNSKKAMAKVAKEFLEEEANKKASALKPGKAEKSDDGLE